MEIHEFKKINAAVDRHRHSIYDWIASHKAMCKAAASLGMPGAEVLKQCLFDRITDDRNLIVAHRHVCVHSGQTAGPDGETRDDYHGEEFAACRFLRDQLRAGKYRHGDTREIRIPKRAGHGSRIIRIPNLHDRVVHRALVQVLAPFFDPFFDNRSFGYRPGRNRLGALACAEQLITAGRTTVVLADLRDAFEHVPIRRLIDLVRQRCGTGPLLNLVRAVLVTGRRCGLRQGAGSSSLGLNLYADKFIDKPWRKACPQTPLARYSDDIAIFCRSLDEGREALERLRRLLVPAGLLLKPVADREAIRDLAAGDTTVWLGYGVSLGENGMVVRITDAAWDRLGARFIRAASDGNDRQYLAGVVRSWLGEMGPAMEHEDHTECLERLRGLLRAAGYRGSLRREAFLRYWRAGKARWMQARQNRGLVPQRPVRGDQKNDRVAVDAHAMSEGHILARR